MSHVEAALTRSVVVVPMVAVMPAMPMAVPADAAQAVMGPDQPATRMVVRGIVVVRIIRVVAASDKEVAMMVVGEAAMMEAAAVERGPTVKGVEAAAVETAAVKASAMEAATGGMKSASMEAATSGMKAASMKAATTVEATATPMEATAAAMKAAAATANLGHESVG